MAITNTTLASPTYVGNGATTIFATGFQFLINTDIAVILTSTAGVETTAVYLTDYTVTGAGVVGGGSVTFLVAPATGVKVNITSNVTLDQQVDYVEGGSFAANTHERALDKLTKITQQLQEQIDRSIRLPVSETGTDVQTNPLEAGYILQVNTAGDALEWADPLNVVLGTELTPTDGGFVVGDGTDFVVETGATARSSLGLGTIATQNASNITITGGSVTGITDIAVADGGTGASTAASARANLGLAIGTDIQAYDAELAALAGLTSAANKLPYFTGLGTAAVADFTAFGRTLVDDADASAARTTLGLVIGTDVQAQDASLTSLALLGTAADRIAYTTGVDTWAETALTTFGRSLIDDADAAAGRTTLGLGTMATQAAGAVAITGGTITGITDLALADGGTGTSLTDPNADRVLFWDDSLGALTWLTMGTNLTITGTTLDAAGGGGGGAPTGASYVTLGTDATLTSERVLTGTTNQITVTDGGAGGNVTLSTPQNLHTAATPQFASLEVGHASDTTLARSSAGNLTVEGNLLYRAGGTDVPVADGGTGLSSTTAYAVLCGGTTSTGALQSVASVGTSGQVLTSNGAGALPTFQAAGGGGGWVKITSTIASNSTTVDFTGLSSTYRMYMVVLENISLATDTTTLELRTSSDGGATYASAGGSYGYSSISFDGTVSNVISNDSTGALALVTGNTTVCGNQPNEKFSGVVEIYGHAAAEFCTVLSRACFTASDGVSVIHCTTGGRRRSAAIVDAIRFFAGSGNIASGTFTLYGLTA